MSTTYQNIAAAVRANRVKEKCATVGIHCTDTEPGKMKIASALPPKTVENQLIIIDPTMRMELKSKEMGTEGVITVADILPLNE